MERSNQKSHDIKVMPQKRQRLDSIKESEHLGAYGGYGPKTVGAVCDPRDFTGVFEAPPGVLGPRNCQVVVDLLADERAEPLRWPGDEVGRHVFHRRHSARADQDLPLVKDKSMPTEGETKPCSVTGCKGTMTYNSKARPPG